MTKKNNKLLEWFGLSLLGLDEKEREKRNKIYNLNCCTAKKFLDLYENDKSYKRVCLYDYPYEGNCVSATELIAESIESADVVVDLDEVVEWLTVHKELHEVRNEFRSGVIICLISKKFSTSVNDLSFDIKGLKSLMNRRKNA